jgi:hypothetical protein
MRRRRISTAGLALAAISGPAIALVMLTAGSAAAAAGQPAVTASVQQRLALTSDVIGATREHAKATGKLTATGTAIFGRRSGTTARTWLVFKHGSIKLVTFQTSSSASVPNPSTCKFTEVFRGSYEFRGGTRRYVHGAGSGHFVTKFWGRLKRVNGSCTSQLAAFRQGTWTSGSISW